MKKKEFIKHIEEMENKGLYVYTAYPYDNFNVAIEFRTPRKLRHIYKEQEKELFYKKISVDTKRVNYSMELYNKHN